MQEINNSKKQMRHKTKKKKAKDAINAKLKKRQKLQETLKKKAKASLWDEKSRCKLISKTVEARGNQNTKKTKLKNWNHWDTWRRSNRKKQKANYNVKKVNIDN